MPSELIQMIAVSLLFSGTAYAEGYALLHKPALVIPVFVAMFLLWIGHITAPLWRGLDYRRPEILSPALEILLIVTAGVASIYRLCTTEANPLLFLVAVGFLGLLTICVFVPMLMDSYIDLRGEVEKALNS
jgi:hypothetical protein